MKMFYLYLAGLTACAAFDGMQATLIASGKGSWGWLLFHFVVAVICGAEISGRISRVNKSE